MEEEEEDEEDERQRNIAPVDGLATKSDCYFVGQISRQL